MEDPVHRLANNLRTAREHQGVSVKDTAAALHRDVQWVLDIEAGTVTPAAAEVVALARFFEVKTSDLILGRVANRDASAFFRSSKPDVPEGQALAVEFISSSVKTIRNLQEIQGLGKRFDIPKATSLTEPKNWAESQRQGRSAAASIRAYLNLGDAQVSDLHRVVRSHGALVLDGRLGNGISGVTLNLDDDLQAIVIAESDRGDRQRFTLAHELGHLVMDFDRPVVVSEVGSRYALSTSRGKPYREVRADAFAAELLAPERSLIAFAQSYGKNPREFHHIDVSAAAMEFQVSYGCMAYQFYLLGWLDEAGYEELRSKSSQANGWRQKRGGFRLPSAHMMHLSTAGRALLERALVEGYVTRKKMMEYAADLDLDDAVVSSMVERALEEDSDL